MNYININDEEYPILKDKGFIKNCLLFNECIDKYYKKNNIKLTNKSVLNYLEISNICDEQCPPAFYKNIKYEI